MNLEEKRREVMILKSVLTTVAIAVQSQFWSDSLEMKRNLEKAKEVTQVQVVCGMVALEMPDQIPEYDLQCDSVEQGDN